MEGAGKPFLEGVRAESQKPVNKGTGYPTLILYLQHVFQKSLNLILAQR
jgi:hypothetical protein